MLIITCKNVLECSVYFIDIVVSPKAERQLPSTETLVNIDQRISP